MKYWLGLWFLEVRKWKEEDVDPERVTWLRCYGIPCHAWSIPFLFFLSSLVGKYICCDESTSDFSKLDVASIMIRSTSENYRQRWLFSSHNFCRVRGEIRFIGGMFPIFFNIYN